MRDTLRLQFLLELRRVGTLSAVAETFSYTTSAVSQQLSRLERDFGATLLVPDGRRVKLTAQAEILADEARKILGAWENAHAAVTASLAEVTGTIRLAAFQTASLLLVPPLLKALRHRHPRLQIEFSQAEAEILLPAIVNRELDFAITESFPHHALPRFEGITHAPLMDDPMWLITPAAQVDGAPGTRTRDKTTEGPALEEMAEQDWVFEIRGTPVYHWALNMCRNAGFEPRVKYETLDMVVQHQLIRHGLAVGFFPGLVPGNLAEGVIRTSLPGAPVRTISAAYRDSESANPVIQALLEELRDLIAVHSPTR